MIKKKEWEHLLRRGSQSLQIVEIFDVVDWFVCKNILYVIEVWMDANDLCKDTL